MSERPHVICLMIGSLDGGLHASCYTESPDGGVDDWNGVAEAVHAELGGDAWIVGRTTMAEMAKGEPHPPAEPGSVERPIRLARTDADQYAVALDTRGKLHFREPSIGGDHVVVLLGGTVADSHLAELAADGISYIVSDGDEIDLAAALQILRRELGIDRLLLEGGATVNGSFLAAGLVDELSVVVAPALDARVGMEGIVAHGDEGLKDRTRLTFRGCRPLDHGLVHLRYDVHPS